VGIFSRFQKTLETKECCPEKDQSGADHPSGVGVSECKPKKFKIPLNKTTTDVKKRNGLLIFPCPACEVINTVPEYEVHPILGTQQMCQSCGNFLHIPGGFCTGADIGSLKIYAGLPVAIRKFYIFYRNHPVICGLEEQGLSRIIIQYGIWGVCQKCHHEFSPGVLMNLPQTKSEVVELRSLSSADEMNEMQSLRHGRCPYCNHRILLVIISEIPRYVVSASENLSHRWEED